MNYTHKTVPFPHQREALDVSADRTAFALLMEQGTGKTKVAIDNAAYDYQRGVIDALLVVAPNGVHRNWVDDEFPVHCPVPYEALIWRSGSTSTRGHARAWAELIATKKLAVLAINVDALITPKGKVAIKEFMTKRKVMMVVDESTDIKNPSAKRTKAARTFGRMAVKRRILTGTPTGDGNPLDLYAQFAFLDPAILGHTTYTTFKHEYAIFEQRNIPGQRHSFNVCVGYRNVDKLHQLYAPHSFRVTKAEVLPNLPAKVFTKRYFSLSKEQSRHYADLKREYMTEMPDGSLITATMVITRMLRLQQITCGYIGRNESEVYPISGPNPRLEALQDVLEYYPGKTIIWCRFRPDVDQIMKLLGDKAVRYDGAVTESERAVAKTAFQEGDALYFVGNPKAGGRGLTLHSAENVVFYSNYFDLEPRMQAEDRAHRIGLKHSVTYIDIVAEGTVDEKIITALRDKKELSSLIMQEPYGAWI